jgi:hypothetical protein
MIKFGKLPAYMSANSSVIIHGLAIYLGSHVIVKRPTNGSLLRCD